MITTDLEVLKRKSLPASSLEEGREIAALLEQELASSSTPGVGLAAPQVGVHKRVAIMRTQSASADLVNPRIVAKRGMFVNKGERCLSLPGVSVDTVRYHEVVVEDDLHPAGLVAAGLEAVVLQHEIDHLDGILITDRKAPAAKIGRNDPCPCGALRPDGKPVKHKRCCGMR